MRVVGGAHLPMPRTGAWHAHDRDHQADRKLKLKKKTARTRKTHPRELASKLNTAPQTPNAEAYI